MRSWNCRLSIVDATGPGEKSRHGVGSVTLDLAASDELAREFAWSGEDIGEIGFWHTHPGGTPEPSPEDLRSWVHALKRLSDHRGSRHLHRPHRHPSERRSWYSPQLYAYVVRRGEYRGLVCEPVPVSIWGAV